VLRQRQRGKHKWKPVTAGWQIEEARRQKAAYFVNLEEDAKMWRRGKTVKVRKDRHLALGVQER